MCGKRPAYFVKTANQYLCAEHFIAHMVAYVAIIAAIVLVGWFIFPEKKGKTPAQIPSLPETRQVAFTEKMKNTKSHKMPVPVGVND